MAVRRRRRLRGRLARGDPRRLGPARRPGETKELTDTYYDTEDWRFYRAGYALRVRRDGKRVEATMKSLAPPEDGGLKRRREISEPLRSDGPKLLKSARGRVERLRLLAGARDVRPLFGVTPRRRIFELRPEAGEPEGAEPDGSDGEVVVGPEGIFAVKRMTPREAASAEDITVDALGGIHGRERVPSSPRSRSMSPSSLPTKGKLPEPRRSRGCGFRIVRWGVRLRGRAALSSCVRPGCPSSGRGPPPA